MADNNASGSLRDTGASEKVYIHTKKIYDSCRDKDCIEGLRLYPTIGSKALLDGAASVGNGKAELLYVTVRVDPVAYNRGFYTVTTRWYYRVVLQAYTGAPNPVDADGLCVFDKRAMLFGGRDRARAFGSDDEGQFPGNRPEAVVEAIDPIVLDAGFASEDTSDAVTPDIPEKVRAMFNSDIATDCSGRHVRATLGQFSLVRLERDAHLLIPVCDYCLPENDCKCGENGAEDPYEMFSHIDFPADEFSAGETLDGGGNC
ncbi:MAG: hypothetical protein VB112_09630 [Oscillospiraceae bacterium]|nr:hypothetical protein [Oscillospiraceae bacterium]